MKITRSAGRTKKECVRQPITGATKPPTTEASATPMGAPVCMNAPYLPRTVPGKSRPRSLPRRPLAPDTQPGDDPEDDQTVQVRREPAQERPDAVSEYRPLEDDFLPEPVRENAEGHSADGRGGEGSAENKRELDIGEVQLPADRDEQERIEDQVVENPTPTPPSS